MSQYGGGRMGGVALPASGTVTQNFSNIPKGPVSRLFLTLTLSLISTAAAFAAVVSTAGSAAAEGVDDLDLLLNAIFNFFTLYWEAGNQCGSLTPAQWRTVLGLFNQSDFSGGFLNGTSIPVSTGSAKQVNIVLPIPVSLENYFEDGGIFANGSNRLETGQLDYNIKALTPTVVMANGSAVVSGLSVSLLAESGAGTENDIGHTWKVNRQANLSTVYQFGPGMRIALLDAAPAPSNACTAYNVEDFQLWTPTAFQTKYQQERLNFGGYDVTQRCTPLLWIGRNRKFTDFVAQLGVAPKVDAVSGVSSLTVYDIVSVPPAPAAIERVSTKAGGGGQVTITHPTPRSLPPGTPIPAELAPLLPVRVMPGTPAGGANTGVAATPAGAAAAQTKKQLNSSRLTFFGRAFGRK